MTFLTVPINTTLPNQKFRITLSGTIFTLEFIFNGRMGVWTMNINDSSGNQILQGMIILIERNLTSQYTTLAIPVGIFFATDDTGQEQEAGLNSWGIDHTFGYVDPTQ